MEFLKIAIALKDGFVHKTQNRVAALSAATLFWVKKRANLSLLFFIWNLMDF